MKERVINIIGMGQTSHDIPDTGEMWCLSDAYMYVKPDKMFLMHAWETTEAASRGRGVFELLSNHIKDESVEVITPGVFPISNEKNELIKQTVAYPITEVSKITGGLCFGCSFAYAVGMAMLEKVDRIRLYGIEFWSQDSLDEYKDQAENKFQILDMAKGAGIKIDMPYMAFRQSRNKYNLYGYDSYIKQV